MSTYVLALDQGTTSSRAILFNQNSEPVAFAQQEFQQYFPQPGWVEHNPVEIWQSQLDVCKRVIAKARISAKTIAAIGITNQRETSIIWNKKNGKPLGNAIVWQDRRTSDFIDQLKQDSYERQFQLKTGLLLDSYFSAGKLVWLLENVAGARTMAERGNLVFGTVDSWLAFNLTGGQEHITDVSNASRTQLYNIHQRCWDDEILQLLNIPHSVLPAVKSSSEIYAETDSDLFGGPIPIAGIAGDQQAALYGQACFQPGQAKSTFGTGCFLMLNTGQSPLDSQNKLLTTIAWQSTKSLDYALEGSVFMAGAIVQWLRDELHILKTAAEIEPLASTVKNNGGVCFVPAFTGLGAPHWDQSARGALLGLTRGSNAGHIARAALEAIALQVFDVVDAIRKDGKQLTELRVDGGAANNDLLMQIQADLLGIPVIRPMVTETTALGAAYLAGVATGYWSDQSEIVDLWREDKRFEPTMPEEDRQRLLDMWYGGVERSKYWDTVNNQSC